MTAVADPTLYWAVLARTRGEVLAAEAQSPGLHLGVMGVPERFNQREAEAWLYDIIGVAHEAIEGADAAVHIPPLLKHALTGLVFSHAELWDPAGEARPCSFAFAHTVREVGFGLVGEGHVTLWVDGEIVDPQWVVVRDEAGREARAWCIASDHSVQVRITWARPGEEESQAGAEVEAVWSAAPAAATSDAAAREMSPAAAVDRLEAMSADAGATALDSSVHETARESLGETPPHGDAEETEGADAVVAAAPEEGRRGGSAIARWLRRGLSWFGGNKRAPHESATSPAPDAMISPSAAGAEPMASAIEPAEAPLEILSSASPEPSWQRAPAAAPRPSEPRVVDLTRMWAGVPDRVPPTPEAREVTARTVGWSAPPDPRAIHLPPAASRPPEPATVGGLPVDEMPDRSELVIESWSVRPPPDASVREADADVAVEPPPAAQRPAEPDPPSEAAYAPDESASPEGAAESLSGPLEVATRPVEVASAPPARAVRRLILPQQRTWPTLRQLTHTERPLWQRPWVWMVVVVALFAGGWLLGAMQDDAARRDGSRPGGLSAAIRALGLGGPKFQLEVASHPPGAWIAVDGKAASARTPAEIDLSPGEHKVTLSFADLGGASYTVRGLKDERVPLEATLWGALEIFSPNEVGVVTVTVDGVARGFAPLRVDSLSPGVHELRFAGPATPAWGQTVDLHVGETREILARAIASPASGVLQVQGTMTAEQGTQPLKGGQVWIDGEPRGVTPLSLDLPRGPHSVRVAYRGQEAPIQVLDLPGGNQRFAVFEFGLDNDSPRLLIDLPARVPRDRPVVISATLHGASSPDAREMWLHAQVPGGPWRRYPMTLLGSTSGTIGTTIFPIAVFDAQGRARYYVSAQYGQGEESFSEMRTALLEKPAAP